MESPNSSSTISSTPQITKNLQFGVHKFCLYLIYLAFYSIQAFNRRNGYRGDISFRSLTWCLDEVRPARTYLRNFMWWHQKETIRGPVRRNSITCKSDCWYGVSLCQILGTSGTVCSNSLAYMPPEKMDGFTMRADATVDAHFWSTN